MKPKTKRNDADILKYRKQVEVLKTEKAVLVEENEKIKKQTQKIVKLNKLEGGVRNGFDLITIALIVAFDYASGVASEYPNPISDSMMSVLLMLMAVKLLVLQIVTKEEAWVVSKKICWDIFKQVIAQVLFVFVYICSLGEDWRVSLPAVLSAGKVSIVCGVLLISYIGGALVARAISEMVYRWNAIMANRRHI